MGQSDVLVARGVEVSIQTVLWADSWEDTPFGVTHTSSGRSGRRGSWSPVRGENLMGCEAHSYKLGRGPLGDAGKALENLDCGGVGRG